MLNKLNKSKNKDMKKIGKILSTIDKNNKNKSEIKITTSRFKNENDLIKPEEIQKIDINVYEEKNINDIKNQAEEIKKYLAPETIFKISLKTK